MPILSAIELPEASTQDFVGPIPPWRQQLRKQRIKTVHEVPEAVAVALPGAIASLLPPEWQGSFLVGRYPGALKSKLIQVLEKDSSIDPILNELQSNNGQMATLVSWVSQLQATPITQEALPGDWVDSQVGPISVNLFEESYRIRASIGMALVAADGEVILRYQDEFESILDGQRTPPRVGRDLAQGLAEEVVKMWALEHQFAFFRG